MARLSKTTVAGMCLLLAVVTSAVNGADITVNLSTKYQTIEGFGAFSKWVPKKLKEGPFYVEQPLDSFYDVLVHDFGFSMLRTEIPCSFKPSSGASYDYNAGDGLSTPVRTTYRHFREVKARGLERFIVTVWSPPAWMNKEQCLQRRRSGTGRQQAQVK